MSLPNTLKKNISQLMVTKPVFGKGDFGKTSVKLDGKEIKVKLVGTLIYKPTEQKSKEYGQKYTVGINFDAGECELFDKILLALRDNVSNSKEQWEPKLPHDDGTMFLKLGTNKTLTKFSAETNSSITPMDLGDDSIDVGMDVAVELTVGGWYLKKDDENKYGLSFKTTKLNFGPVEKPKARKRKPASDDATDDEVRVYLLINFLILKRLIFLIVPQRQKQDRERLIPRGALPRMYGESW